MSTELEALERISQQLEVLINLTALTISSDKPMIERAVRLQKAGLQPKDIAKLVDSTPNAVSVALAKAKRQKK